MLLHFSDQPQKVAEALRAIEGIPEDVEDISTFWDSEGTFDAPPSEGRSRVRSRF